MAKIQNDLNYLLGTKIFLKYLSCVSRNLNRGMSGAVLHTLILNLKLLVLIISLTLFGIICHSELVNYF